MSKFLTDATGTYDLSQVAAITPMTYRDQFRQITSQIALLLFVSGRRAVTGTDYKTATTAWQAVVNPGVSAPAPASPSPAAASPAAA